MLCGIEIHQRLSGSKLFCGCDPSETVEGGKAGGDASAEYGASASFTRRLHAVRSELGELDSAVRLESMRERSFQYDAPLSSACLVEADEEPPHHLNPNALHTLLVFCELFSSSPVDQLHIMRKNVIDGSNTSGFQRTAVVGLGGQVQTPVGKLGIQTICLEEESAGISESKDSRAHYLLDRLGIPLVELATAPTLKSGKEAQEAALAIGTLLRKTGMVQRGIGSIRQDLNVSIPEGARVEIKGVQELSIIAATVDLEVKRQQNLLVLASEIKQRLSGKPIEAIFVDITSIFEGTKSQLVSKQLKAGAKVLAMALPNHAGILGRELLPNRRYGTELADYARAAGIRGLIHSDEDMAKYGFSDDELSELRMALSLGKNDAFAIVVGEEKKARAALSEVCCRANFLGVPEETRKANPDGTSSYMRPLPGKARLYPETDLPPIEITKEMLAAAKKTAKVIEMQEEKKEETLSVLNDELKKQLSYAKGLLSHNPAFSLSSGASPELAAFAEAIKSGTDSKFAASVLTNTLQSLKREGEITLQIDEPRLLAAFADCQKGIFAKAAMAEILRAMCKDASVSPEDAASRLGLQKVSGKALQKLIETEKLDIKGIMAKYRLVVDASEAQEIIAKIKK